jgi:hypothetical protein
MVGVFFSLPFLFAKSPFLEIETSQGLSVTGYFRMYIHKINTRMNCIQ